MRRSRKEIKFDTLTVIGRGTSKPTKLMYRVNLSWVMLHEYLEYLKSEGLITESQHKSRHGNTVQREYFLTTKGKEALRAVQSADTLLGVKHEQI